MSLSHVFDSLLRMLGMRTLNQQFLFSYALMFLLAVTASVALYLSMSVSPETINVAGAQRMLSQKMTKEALLLRQGASERKSLEATIAQFDHPGRQALHRIAIVEHDDLRPLELGQCLFETFPRRDVEVVQRLIQQQQVRAAQHQQREHQPCPLAV